MKAHGVNIIGPLVLGARLKSSMAGFFFAPYPRNAFPLSPLF